MYYFVASVTNVDWSFGCFVVTLFKILFFDFFKLELELFSELFEQGFAAGFQLFIGCVHYATPL